MESLCIAADLRMYENKRAGEVPGERRNPRSKISSILPQKPKREIRPGIQQ
jgi:hypothetical protein